ncbi:MAG TPA: aldo/keto reductase, partial [Segetibacter sp.]
FSGSVVRNDPNSWGNHRKNIMRSIEKSLKNLNTDYIDLYWLHIWEYTTRPEEVLRALDDLVKQGKILYTGISDTPAWIVSQSNAIADFKGWTPFTAIQIEYNLLHRSVEYDLLTMAKTLGLGVLAWSPLAMGVLSGKLRKDSSDTKREAMTQGRINETNNKIVDEVIRIAKEVNKTPSQVALNWLMQQSEQIFPIVGARKGEQLNDNMQSTEFALEKKHLDALDKVSKPKSAFPYSMWDGGQMIPFISKGADNITNWNMPFDYDFKKTTG